MKITLVAPTEMPSRRANTIQVAKMAQALKQLGHEVYLLVPAPNRSIADQLNRAFNWQDFAEHYGLHEKFPVKWLATNPKLRRYDYGLRSLLWARQWGADLIYTRLPQCAALASSAGFSVVYEVHDFPRGNVNPFLLRTFIWGRGKRRLIVITHALANDITKAFGITHDQVDVVIAPDGVDIERYEDIPDPQQARSILDTTIANFPNRFTAGYSGHFYAGRGLQLLFELAARQPDMNFLIMGGENQVVEEARAHANQAKLTNIFLTGFIPNAELPLYQASCEVLLMPYQKQVSGSSGGDIAPYLSPMKVFEYLACGRVIISSDLPVLREVINEKFAFLLPSEQVDLWLATLRKIAESPTMREEMGELARKEARKYSWQSRAVIILGG